MFCLKKSNIFFQDAEGIDIQNCTFNLIAISGNARYLVGIDVYVYNHRQRKIGNIKPSIAGLQKTTMARRYNAIRLEIIV